MALLHFDGFSAYSARAELDRVYIREGLDANLNVMAGDGPSDIGAVRLGGVNTFQEAGFFFQLASLQNVTFLGIWFRFNGWDTSGGSIQQLICKWTSNTTTVRASLDLREDGSLVMRRLATSTIIFDSANASLTFDNQLHFLSRGQEYKIEVMIEGGFSGAMEIRVNDEVWGRVIDVNLGGTHNRIHFKANEQGSGADYTISDLYICDDSGDVNNNFLGSTWAVEVLRPTGDSAQIDFTPDSGVDSYAMVDDAPKHNADADANESTANAQIDRFTTADELLLKAVAGVAVVNVARHTGAAQNFRGIVHEGSTTGEGATVALGAAYEPLRSLFETNPDTGERWEKEEVQGCEFGYESRA